MKAINLSKIIFFLAVVLLCQQAWVPGYFQDGYLYAALGKHASELGHWLVPHLSETTYSRFSHHPPLYFMLEGLFFKIFGSDWTQSRLFGVSWVLIWLFGMRKFLKEIFSVDSANLFVFTIILMPDILKKARFPNLDFALAAMCAFALLVVIRKCGTRQWLQAGLLLGLAFWFKGIAVLIFGPVFVFFLLEKGGEFRKWGPYCCVLVFLTVSALWPIILSLTGNGDIFESYLAMQLTGTAINGRGEMMPFYTYAFHVLKVMPHILLIIAWGIWVKGLDYFKTPVVRLGVIWFVPGFVVLSCLKFKYSHYLIPYYPGLALLAIPGLLDIKSRLGDKFERIIAVLAVCTAVALLVLPLTTKLRRHPELINMEEQLEWRNLKPQKFFLVDNAYEFWSSTNYIAYRYSQGLDRVTSSDFLSDPKHGSVLITAPGLFKNRAEILEIWSNHRASIYFYR